MRTRMSLIGNIREARLTVHCSRSQTKPGVPRA
jgi:hypothetical protein